jgi:hypothetical protein
MNDYGKTLANTGLGGLAIGGYVIDQWWLVAVAAGLIVVGILGLRFGWRRGKSANQA